VAELLEVSRRHGSNMVDSYEGAEKINRESLLELDVDVLLPCARHHSIHPGNVAEIKARVISPGANAPATDEAERILAERAILCVPDFIANSGGVLGGTMEFAGLSRSAIIAFTEHDFARQVSGLIEKSKKEGVYIRKIAEDLAGERFGRMRAASGSGSIRKRAFSLALGFYRNGMIPGFFVGPPARKYFQRRIQGSF
jgi:glutamate dehydrogenase (NAD(P)+)